MKVKYSNGKRMTKSDQAEINRQLHFIVRFFDRFLELDGKNLTMDDLVNMMRSENMKFELISMPLSAFDKPEHPEVVIEFDDEVAVS